MIKCIADMDFNKVKRDLQKNSKGFYKMEAIKMDVLPICESSTILMGHYQSPSSPPSFFTVNLTYIDMLK